MHETRIKVKRGGRWIDVEDLAEMRHEEEERRNANVPPVEVGALPGPDKLDSEVPVQQVFYEHPEVRRYITEDGHIRRGLAPEHKAVAMDILRRYGGST
jgi:hypothetical protein